MSRQISLSSTISAGLQTLYSDAAHQEVAPPHIARNVMSHVRKSQLRRFLDRVGHFSTGRVRPALALAVLLVVVVTSVTINRKPATQDPSVAQALEEVKWTLALLSDVSNTTATTVKESVIESRMVYPVSRSLNTVMDN